VQLGSKKKPRPVDRHDSTPGEKGVIDADLYLGLTEGQIVGEKIRALKGAVNGESKSFGDVQTKGEDREYKFYSEKTRDHRLMTGRGPRHVRSGKKKSTEKREIYPKPTSSSEGA